MLVLGLFAILFCRSKGRIGAAILLAGGMVEAIRHVRFQAIFAILVVVIGGTLFSELGELPFFKGKRAAIGIGFALGALIVVTLRTRDLLTQRHYVNAGEIALFGAGESWWFPEKAMDFLEREKAGERRGNDRKRRGSDHQVARPPLHAKFRRPCARPGR